MSTLLPDSVLQQRRARMQRVGRENTAPELVVRRALHAAGLRYRLHVRDLPGTPDIVLRGRKTVVFVHGCFWHGHDCVRGQIRPKRNAEFWARKLASNTERDRRKARELRALGWHVETIWECGVRSLPLRRLISRISRR